MAFIEQTTRSSSFIRFMLVFALLAVAVIGCSDFGSGLITDDGGNGGGIDTGTVSFATQIMPIFQANCSGNGCHIPCATNNGGRLCLVSYATLIGDDVIDTANVEDSRIIRSLVGGRGLTRMPYGSISRLPDSTIQLIRTWMTEGAQNN